MPDLLINAMFGCYAMHVPLNCIIQSAHDKGHIVTIVGQSAGTTPSPLLYGSRATHQLILGDAVIRPHAIIESDQFRGYGVSALVTMSPTDWLDEPHKILLDQIGKAEIRRRLRR